MINLENAGQHMSTTTKIFTAVIPRIHGTSVVTEGMTAMVWREAGTPFEALESAVPSACSYSIVWWWSVFLLLVWCSSVVCCVNHCVLSYVVWEDV